MIFGQIWVQTFKRVNLDYQDSRAKVLGHSLEFNLLLCQPYLMGPNVFYCIKNWFAREVFHLKSCCLWLPQLSPRCPGRWLNRETSVHHSPLRGTLWDTFVSSLPTGCFAAQWAMWKGEGLTSCDRLNSSEDYLMLGFLLARPSQSLLL